MRYTEVTLQELAYLGYHFQDDDNMSSAGYILYEDGSVDTTSGDTVVTSRQATEWANDPAFQLDFKRLREKKLQKTAA